MRACIAAIPDGSYVCTDLFEDDGLGGEGVNLRLTVTVADESVRVDFDGTGPQVRSAINVPLQSYPRLRVRGLSVHS